MNFIEHKGTLTKKEFHLARVAYEKVHGFPWIPIDTPEQNAWLAAFEEAKEVFAVKINNCT